MQMKSWWFSTVCWIILFVIGFTMIHNTVLTTILTILCVLIIIFQIAVLFKMRKK